MRADIHDGPEHKGSNQRPDTLMQDRISRVVETSCTARPDHTVGQILPPPNVRGMSVILRKLP